jgi:ABC-2 type transport system permease protein/lipopolysaccharide transport system permease protein
MMTDVRTTKTPPHAEFFPANPSPRESLIRLWAGRVASDRRELGRFWPVIQNMVIQELRVRYQRSFLGFLWTLLNPILMMTTMSIVFAQIFHIDTQKYSIYLFSGLVPWSFLAGSINDSAFCIITQESLIRKIYLPKLVFPLAKLLINLITFLLSFVAMFLLLGPLGARPSWPMLALPLVLGLYFVFVLGLGLVLATANTFFRDCGHLVSVFLQAWYFLTPIIYEVTDLPAEVRGRLWLNPAFPFVRLFQTIIRSGQWPDLFTFLMAAGLASVSLGIGYVVFKSNEDKLVFRL